MEPESLLPYSQVPATCPYPEPTPCNHQNPLPTSDTLSFLFSLGQYEPKRNLTQHNFFIPKC